MTKFKKSITKSERNSLIDDINEGVLTKKELVIKYKYPSINSLNGIMYWFRQKGLIPAADQKPVVVEAPVAKKQYKKRVAKETIAPAVVKVVTNSIRTINFPDGFKIQIEKSFVSGVLIHKNGNITIVK